MTTAEQNSNSQAVTERTFTCTGFCKRTGLSMKALMCVPGANSCPYCGGKVICEQTNQPKSLPENPLTVIPQEVQEQATEDEGQEDGRRACYSRGGTRGGAWMADQKGITGKLKEIYVAAFDSALAEAEAEEAEAEEENDRPDSEDKD